MSIGGREVEFNISSPFHPGRDFPLNGSAVVTVEDDDCHDDADGGNGHHSGEVNACPGRKKRERIVTLN